MPTAVAGKFQKAEPSPEHRQDSEILEKLLSDKQKQLHDNQKRCNECERALGETQEKLARYKDVVQKLYSRSPPRCSRDAANKWTFLDIANITDLKGFRADLVIVYDPKTGQFDKLNRAYLPEQHYIKLRLPSFHWWNDTIVIYQHRNDVDEKTGRPRMSAEKGLVAEYPDEDKRGTVPLGKLGLDVRLQRLRGKIRDMYLLSDTPNWTEMQRMKRRESNASSGTDSLR